MRFGGGYSVPRLLTPERLRHRVLKADEATVAMEYDDGRCPAHQSAGLQCFGVAAECVRYLCNPQEDPALAQVLKHDFGR
jgi:hypothetical protein